MQIKNINFEKYRCKILKEMAETIEFEWNERSNKISLYEIESILKNIYRKNSIKKGDTIKILANILGVSSILEKKFDKHLSTLFEKLVELSEKDEDLFVVKNLDVFYDNLLSYFDNKNIEMSIFLLVDKIMTKNIKFEENLSKKTKILLNIKESRVQVVDFFVSKFSNNYEKYLIDSTDIEADYYIGKNTKLFRTIFKKMLELKIKNILKNQNYNINESSFTIFNEYFNNLSEKKEIYKQILDLCQEFPKLTFAVTSDKWFHSMSLTLGELKRETRYLGAWEEFNENQREVFIRWYLNEKLDEFFGRKVNDPERTEFWKEYVQYLKNIEFYEEAGQAIVMEFSDHTIVEFGQKGNAAYVYPRDEMKIKSINIMYARKYSKSVMISKLKKEEIAIRINDYIWKAGWIHTSDWQRRFEYRLRELGYRL